MKGLAVGGILALATIAVVNAQTCPCTRSPIGSEITVLAETSLGSGVCVPVTRPTGGCYCDLDGLEECEVVESTKFEYTSGDSCAPMLHSHAVCDDSTFVVETDACEEDRRVSYTKDCSIKADLFPAGATVTGVQMFITQTDNFTFSGQGLTVGEEYSLSYVTRNNYLPSGFFGEWPDTPTRQATGNIPPALQVDYFEASDSGTIRLVANSDGIEYVRNAISGGSDALFRYMLSIDTQTEGFGSYVYFPNWSYIKIVFRVTFTL
mmetsp:Transcript_11826/g.25647  ORF Transcript_11826/g.25647 Transcript_11826/m.25647 type:complete len:264 (+) Transcript_11826:323-1114(+)